MATRRTPKSTRPARPRRRTKAVTPRPTGATRPARVARQARATQPARASVPATARRAANAASGTAPGMQAVNTFLAVANVRASVEFLERAIGFSRGVVLADPSGQLRYAEVRRGDTVIMLVGKGDETAPAGGAPALYAYVDDVDRASAAARDAGAAVADAEDKPWGDRAAVMTDPDGYRWVLATFKKLVPFSPPG